MDTPFIHPKTFWWAGLLTASLACNTLLLFRLQSDNESPNLHRAESKPDRVVSSAEMRFKQNGMTSIPWQEWASMDDASFITKLNAFGMPASMVHTIAIGRVEAERLKNEERLLFETPYWMDASSDLMDLHRQSQARVDKLSMDILGDSKPSMGAVEKIRRSFGRQKWRLNIPRFKTGSSTQYFMAIETLEAAEKQMLESHLTPEALEAYERRYSWKARQMSSLLNLMGPSQEEFDTIMKVEFEKEAMETFNEDLWRSHEALFENLQKTLGKERFHAYNLSQMPVYNTMMALKERFGLSEGETIEILQMNASLQHILMNGPGRFPDEPRHAEEYRQRLLTILSAEAYEALKEHGGFYFPREPRNP